MAINRTQKRHRYRSKFFMYKPSKKTSGTKEAIIFTELNVQHTLKLEASGQQHKAKLVKLISAMHSCANNRENFVLNFYKTQKIYLTAMILLYAELKNIKNLYPELKIKCKMSSNSKINHLLCQLGIFKLLHTNFSKTRKYRSVDSWVALSGTRAIEELYEKLNNRFNLSEIINSSLYRGCIEATINASAHAYIGDRTLSKVDYKKEAWWLFAEMRDGYLTVSICDLGVGIATTIPTNYPVLARFTKIFGDKSESGIILRAINFANKNSRTGKAYRGNGLPAIASITKKLYNAELEIYSHKAYLNITKEKETMRDEKISIPGTIITWVIPIGDSNENNYFNRQ